ncbi:hypothetical protein APHAL10511_003827 [Amanita phalloides]|nr:hypothetical protein APHAL10511_003827 [Amanita phalloides]
MGKQTLDHYYDLMDQSQVYHVAIVLHPQHKLHYFRNAGWQDEKIRATCQIVHETYEQSYKMSRNASKEAGDDLDDSEDKVEQRKRIKINIFDSLPALAVPKPSQLLDKLDHYLSMDPQHTPNALAWWHEQCKMYPTLSCMVFDYLSVPGMSLLNLLDATNKMYPY